MSELTVRDAMLLNEGISQRVRSIARRRGTTTRIIRLPGVASCLDRLTMSCCDPVVPWNPGGVAPMRPTGAFRRQSSTGISGGAR